MSEPQTITTDHVRALLDADDGATLGLSGGRVEVIPAGQLGSEKYLGALEVVSRDELVQRLGDDPGDEDIDREAAALTTATRTLGG